MNALRRDIDSKTHTLLAVTLGLLGIIGAFRVWVSLHPNGQPLFITALLIYLAVIGLGVFSSYPRTVFMPYSRAIHEFQDSAGYDDMTKWVAEDILDLIDDGAKIVERKSQLLEVMLWLIIVSSGILLVSVAV
jgi:hypothetical protein